MRFQLLSGWCDVLSAGYGVPVSGDLNLHERRTDSRHVARAAVQRDHFAGDGRGHLHRCLVGHDIDEVLVLLDSVPRLDVPGDDLRLGSAFADIGKLEDVAAHCQASRVRRMPAAMRSGSMK